MNDSASLEEACLGELDSIDRAAAQVRKGPLRPHKHLCQVLKRQAGYLQAELEDSPGQQTPAWLRDLQHVLAAARTLIQSFAGDGHCWLETYWTTVDKSADFLHVFDQLNSHLKDLEGNTVSYETTFVPMSARDQKELPSILSEMMACYAADVRADHLSEAQRTYLQQQWARCSIVLNRAENLAECKGPYLAELKQQYIFIGQAVARGTFGQVHLGALFGSEVAIKTLDVDANDATTVAEVQLEATHIAGLQHACLVLQYGYSLDPAWNRLQLLLEPMHSSLLDELKHGRLSLTVQQVCIILLQVAQGLSYLHDRDMVHGNLNLANVMLSSGEGLGVKLSDYSREAARSAPRGGRLYSLAGTAPETLQGRGSSPAADVYAFGALGRQLLNGDGKLAAPASDTKGQASTCSEVQRLLDACCSSNPASRPSSAHAENSLQRMCHPSQRDGPSAPPESWLHPTGSLPPDSLLHSASAMPQHGVLSSRPATPPSHSQAQAAPNPQHSNALRDRTSLNHRGSGSESISGRTSGFFPSNLSIPDGPHSQPGPSMDPPPSSNGHDLSPKPRRTHTSHDNADSTAGDTGASTGQDGVMLTGDSFTSTMPSLSRGDYCAHEDTAKILGLVKMLKSHPDTAERAKCCDSLAELAAEDGNLKVLYTKAMPVLVGTLCNTRCTASLSALLALLEKEGGADAFVACKGLRDLNLSMHSWTHHQNFGVRLTWEQDIYPIYGCLILLNMLPGEVLRGFKGSQQLVQSLSLIQEHCKGNLDPNVVKTVDRAASLHSLVVQDDVPKMGRRSRWSPLNLLIS